MCDEQPRPALSSEDFADILDRCRENILDDYVEQLCVEGNPLIFQTDSALLRDTAGTLLHQVVTRLRGTEPPPGQRSAVPDMIGALRAAQNIRPDASLRAAAILFTAAMSTVVARLPEDADAVMPLAALASVLHECLVDRLSSGAVGYATYLMEIQHRAHLHERRRVARELHDEVSHSLLAALNDLELHQLYTDEDPARAAAKLAAAGAGLREAIEGVRALAMDLRRCPADGGLAAALRRYISSTSWSGEWSVRVDGDESVLSQTVQGELFLVLREAIRNAHSHSAADSVSVVITLDDNNVIGVVMDDGHGFEPELASSDSNGSGLMSMQERVAILGGRLSVTSAPGKGTQVTVEVPRPHLCRGSYE